MPLYEYKCEKCGDVFEVRQNYSDAPVTVHEKCGGQVEKLISAPSFNFKGSGWYVNDYGKGNNGAKKPESEGKSSSDSSKSTSSDATAKPDSSSKSSETKTSDSGSSSTSTSSSTTSSTTKTSKSE
jgi:putative FmdB family regulatory protein